MSALYLVYSDDQFEHDHFAQIIVDANSGKTYPYTPSAEARRDLRVMALSDDQKVVVIAITERMDGETKIEDISEGSTTADGLKRLPAVERAKAEHAIEGFKAGVGFVMDKNPVARAAFEATQKPPQREHRRVLEAAQTVSV